MIPPPSVSGAAARAAGWGLAVCVAFGAAPLRGADLAAVLAEPAEAVVSTPAAGDPLAGTPWIDPARTGPDAERILDTMLPGRNDSPADWVAPLEPLHVCGEPRVLPPCVPPPPCHPALPPQPFDLVGAPGDPTCGPIYGGPCAPRTGRRDDGTLPRLHRMPDRLFDWFYRSR